MDKNIFNKLLGKDYEETELYRRNKDLLAHNERLEKALDIQKRANKSIADRCISLENKLELLEKDAEQYIEVEIEKRLMQLEDEYKDQMNHKWYSLGRTDAYAEMGIRALNSRKAGTTMYYIKDTGEVIEDITNGLEDVPVEVPVIDLGTVNIPVDSPDEIEIEDLA